MFLGENVVRNFDDKIRELPFVQDAVNVAHPELPESTDEKIIVKVWRVCFLLDLFIFIINTLFLISNDLRFWFYSKS